MKNGASADIQSSDAFVEAEPESEGPCRGRRSCRRRVGVALVCLLGAAGELAVDRRAIAEDLPSGAAAGTSSGAPRAGDGANPGPAPGGDRAPASANAPVAEKPGGVYLSWVRANGAGACPDPVAMQAAVARRLGRDPFSSSAAGSPATMQFLDAIIRREASGWNVVITLADAAGQTRDTRTLRSPASTCTSLAGAAAVAMAVLIDPSAAPVALPTIAAAPNPSPALPNAVTSVSGLGRPRAFAGVVAARGLLPQVGWGATLGIDVRWGTRLGAGLGATFLPEVRTPKPDTNFAFGLTYLSAKLCALFGSETARVWGTACAAGHLGVMHATVYFPEATSPGERSFYALSAEPGLLVRVAGPLRLGLEGAGYVLPWPRDLVVLGRPPGKDVAFAQPRFALLGRVTLGLTW